MAPFRLMGERSLLVQALYKLLSDGEWHDLPDIHLELASLVQPGKASRAAERSRRALRKSAGLDPTTANTAQYKDTFLRGARSYVNHTINNHVRFGGIERQARSGYPTRFRLKEDGPRSE